VTGGDFNFTEPPAKRRKLNIPHYDEPLERTLSPTLAFANGLSPVLPQPAIIIPAIGDVHPHTPVVPAISQKTSKLGSVNVNPSPSDNSLSEHDSTRLAGTAPGLAVAQESSEAATASNETPREPSTSAGQIEEAGISMVQNSSQTGRSATTVTIESAENTRQQRRESRREDQFNDSASIKNAAIAGSSNSASSPPNSTRLSGKGATRIRQDTRNVNAAGAAAARAVSTGGSGTTASSNAKGKELARPRKQAQGAGSATITTDLGAPDAIPTTTSQTRGKGPLGPTKKGPSEARATLAKGPGTAKNATIAKGPGVTKHATIANDVVGENTTDTNTPSTVSGRRTRVTRTSVQHPMNGDAQSFGTEEQDAPSPVTTKRRKTTKHNATNLETGDDITVDDERRLRSTKRKRGRKREPTPDEAEDYEIDPRTVTLEELCKDTRNGKKSKLETAFQGIDWSEVARRKKEADARSATEAPELEHAANEGPDGAGEQPTKSNSGPQLKLVRGQMVIDDSSLVVDRHAEAAANQGELLEELEETDLTTHITSQSWIYDNRREPAERRAITHKSKSWDEDATDAFYEALRMFGTDFFIISKMFPGHTRRHIKLKFVREERANPDRVKRALIGETKTMDLGTYCEATGQEEDFFKDPEVLQEELREQDIRQTAEMEKEREQQREKAKSKQEAAFARSAASGKPVRGPGWNNKKKKKNQDQTTTGGIVHRAEAQAIGEQAHAGGKHTDVAGGPAEAGGHAALGEKMPAIEASA